ncbi:MAG: hypothetical protein AAFM91_15790 [Pseudomonadota bacterium]
MKATSVTVVALLISISSHAFEAATQEPDRGGSPLFFSLLN